MQSPCGLVALSACCRNSKGRSEKKYASRFGCIRRGSGVAGFHCSDFNEYASPQCGPPHHPAIHERTATPAVGRQMRSRRHKMLPRWIVLAVLSLCVVGQALGATACLSCELESLTGLSERFVEDEPQQSYSSESDHSTDLAAVCEGCCTGLTGGQCCAPGAALTADFHYPPAKLTASLVLPISFPISIPPFPSIFFRPPITV